MKPRREWRVRQDWRGLLRGCLLLFALPLALTTSAKFAYYPPWVLLPLHLFFGVGCLVAAIWSLSPLLIDETWRLSPKLLEIEKRFPGWSWRRLCAASMLELREIRRWDDREWESISYHLIAHVPHQGESLLMAGRGKTDLHALGAFLADQLHWVFYESRP
jgi:hypothetical protein